MALPAEDVDVLGNGRLIMRVMQPGRRTEPKPTKGQVVDLQVKVLLVDGEEFPNMGVRSFRLGDGDECDAFELVAPLIYPGDTCALRSVPPAFNLDQALCEARPAATVEAVVELLSVQCQPPVTECSLSVRIAEAKKKKTRGNLLFGRSEFQAAAYSFQLGLSYIAQPCHEYAARRQNGTDGSSASTQAGGEGLVEEDIHLCCTLWTNLALVQLNIPEQIKDAIGSCEAALSLEPKSVKAMYLRAKALLEPSVVTHQNREEALTMLRALLELAPENEAARKMFDAANDEKENGDMVEWSWTQIIVVFIIAAVSVLTGGFCPPVNSRLNTTMAVPGVGVMRGDEM